MVAGPPLISSDLVNRGLPLYFARPLGRKEYVLGKLSVLVILLSPVTWIPQLLIFGLHLLDASLQGAQQVWGALLASTATTVAIFLPVIFMREVEGQLFGDLAITIAIAVVVSLIVAMTVLPLAAKLWLTDETLTDHNAKLWRRITNFVMRSTSTAKKRWLMEGSSEI